MITRASLTLVLNGVTVALALSAATGFAQDHFDVESSDAVTASEGSVLNVYGGRTLERGAYAVALSGSYGRKPLSIEATDDTGGEHLADLVGSIGTLELLGAIGIMQRLELGLAVPIHRAAAGSDYRVNPPTSVRAATLSDSEVGLGDIRVVPRVNLYEAAGHKGFDVAMLASVWLPTGRDAIYAGESFRVEPRAAIDYRTRSWMIAFNAGYLVRSRARVLGTEFDDQVRLGLGADIGLGKGFSVLGELDAHFNVLASDFGSDDVASEALAGLRYRGGGLIAQLGAGPGVSLGLSAPMYRVVASIGLGGSVMPEQVAEEVDIVDPCVREADGTYRVGDGDGCPDQDSDGDGLLDRSDRCPNDPEDVDNFQDEDGCPELDNDGDAIMDAADSCPLEPEDKDGFEDADGCPELDNDKDGIADTLDTCPLEVGVAENNGCPAVVPEPPAAFIITEHNIQVRETFFFGTNNSKLQERSFTLVDNLAKLLNEHPEIEQLVVEGHTDSRGSAGLNKRLSIARARSILEALISRGVDSARLNSEGFGPSRPIAPNDSDENRALNRRVELRIDRRRQAP